MITSISEKRKHTLYIALALNIMIVIMEFIGAILSSKQSGLEMLQFYTEDSNLLSLVACATYTVFLFRYIKNEGKAIPYWVRCLKYVATCCLTVTFLVVITILSPMQGKGGYQMMLFYGSMLYNHFLCPIAILISFIFVDYDKPVIKKEHKLIALIPTLLYAIVTLTLNITKTMEGPYPFLRVYDQPFFMSVIWFIVIIGMAFLIAWLVMLAQKKAPSLYED